LQEALAACRQIVGHEGTMQGECGQVDQIEIGPHAGGDHAADRAVNLGLGYPKGPLGLGDALGAENILDILRNMQSVTGDPRYRPSLWLQRRVQLGMSLLST
jgi:hypothetical protein